MFKSTVKPMVDVAHLEKPLVSAARSLFQANAAALRSAGVKKLVIFGSIARGDHHEGSDIDLMVVPQDGLQVGGLQIAKWRVLLSDMTSRNADVVVEKFSRATVLRAVEADGIELFHM
jgi:uncharacterized protein